MIKTYYFILLLVVSGFISTLADEDDAIDDEDGIPEDARNCISRLNEECPTDSFPDEFPKTADELLAFCRSVSELGRCALRVREDCENYDEALLTHIRTVVNYVDATCQTGNPTFEAIAGDLECIKVALNASEGICRAEEYSEETREYVESRVFALLEEALHLNEDNSHCVNRLFFIGCPAITVGIHCGNKARNAVYEVLQKAESYGLECDDEVMNEIEPLLDLLEEVMIERLSEENAIGDQK